jgi:hypothetical protein
MPQSIHLYVSSSPGLTVEREIVAQVVASLPLTLGWEIGHTPLPGRLQGEGIIGVEESDLYALLLGHDFAAPMGQELRVARALGREPFAAYRFEGTLSPSAQDAVRTLELAWQRFSSLERFRAIFRQDLLRKVLDQATTLGLGLREVQRLVELVREDREGKEPEALEGVDRRRSEAGQSGRILGREVWEVED